VTNYVTIAYRTDLTAAYTDLESSPGTVGRFDANGKRIEMPANTSGKIIDVREDFVNAVNTETPVVEGTALHEAIRPSLKLQYGWTVEARQHAPLHDGRVDRRTGSQIRDAMQVAAGAEGSITAVMPDGATEEISIIDYSESLPARPVRYGLSWQIPMQAVQFRTLTVAGTWERVGAYTWGALAGYNWSQLPGL